MSRLRLKTNSAARLIRLPRLFTLLGPMALDYFNRGWLDLLGKSLEDVCGWRWNARRTVRSDYPDSNPQDHKSFPVLIMGTDYRHETLRLIEQMAKAGMIAPSDMQVVYVTDSVDDAITHIRSPSQWRWLW